MIYLGELPNYLYVGCLMIGTWHLMNSHLNYYFDSFQSIFSIIELLNYSLMMYLDTYNRYVTLG